MNKCISLAAFIFILFSCISCKTVDPNVTYFRNMDEMISSLEADAIPYEEIKIATDDALSILVSATDPGAVSAFNLPLVNSMSPGQLEITTTPVMQSYLVDAKGDIDFPVLGKIHVAGYTRSELTEVLKEKISRYVKNPLVTIRILNFKIAVLGEVAIPGTKTITNERVSILDALSLAGDLTIYGERTNVLLVRNTEGKREIHRFDLTSGETLQSPYFYLRQNDVVYVEPNKARASNARYSQNSQYNVSVVSTIISAISVVASLTIALLVK